jgi:hypothetical protein
VTAILTETEMTAESKTESNPSDDEASAAFKALAKIFTESKGNCGYREYKLERINGELVFRQTEFDALFEAALDDVFGTSEKAPGLRRIIRSDWLELLIINDREDHYPKHECVACAANSD